MKRISVNWLLVFLCLFLCAGCASLEPPKVVPGTGAFPPQGGTEGPAGTSDDFPLNDTEAQIAVALLRLLVGK